MVSVVIPAYNEETVLPHTLRELVRQRGDYEVLVVDGGSTDRTCDTVVAYAGSERTACADVRTEPRGLRTEVGSGTLSPQHSVLSPVRLLMARKGRAFQMNAGANEARGEWLLFLHADTVLPAGAIQHLNNLEANYAIQAGGFLHQFSGDDWRLRLISFLDNFRCARSRIIYGDQALFIRRSVFHKLGGFPDQPILEDVAFCEKLIAVTEPILLDQPVITDSRKFVQMGIWRSFVRVLAIILHVEWGLPILPHAFFRDIR